MPENITINTGILVLMTEGHLYGEDANDARIPHFPQNTFYAAPISKFSEEARKQFVIENAKLKGKLLYTAPSNTRVSKGADYVRVDNSPPRHALKSAKYPLRKQVTFQEVTVNAELVTYGGNSGITIGVGCDIGARNMSKDDVQDVFGKKLGVPQKMVDILKNACGKKWISAAHALGDHEMRKFVRLTQQQVCNLLTEIWPGYEAAARRGMKQSYDKLHPALREVFSKICYGYGHVPKTFKNATDGPLASMSHVEQCVFLKKQLVKYNISSADKFGKYIDKIHSVLTGGGTVTVSREPANIEELVDPNNPTLDWVGQVGKYPAEGSRSLRARMVKASKEEPARMKAAYERINEEYVPVDDNNNSDNTTDDNTNVNGGSIFGPVGTIIQAAFDQIKSIFGISDEVKKTAKAIQAAYKAKGKLTGSVGVGGKNNAQDVIAVKFLLYKQGKYDISITDLISNFTGLDDNNSELENAIRDFQSSNGVSNPDGRVDVNGSTIKWLLGQEIPNRNDSNNNSTPPDPVPVQGNLKQAQQILIDNGYLAPTFFSKRRQKDVSSADGLMGDMTRTALRDFQTAHEISVTGELDGATNAIIFDATKVKPKGQSNTDTDEEPTFAPASLDANVFPCFN